MANIGLRYAAFSRVQSHTDGSAITYDEGKEVGMMISANVAITRSNNRLYANDVVAEEDNSITEAQITINLDDLTLDNEEYMCGLTKTTATNVSKYEDNDDPAPIGGFGYVRVRSKTNQTTGITAKTYIATWWYKVRARIEAEAAQTKGETVEWSTPSLILRAMGAFVDSSGKMKFRVRQEFSSYDEAKAYINGLANIT